MPLNEVSSGPDEFHSRVLRDLPNEITKLLPRTQQKNPRQQQQNTTRHTNVILFSKRERVDSADQRASIRRTRLIRLTLFPLCMCFILLVSFGLVLDSCQSGGQRTMSVGLSQAFLSGALNIRKVGKLRSIFSDNLAAEY